MMALNHSNNEMLLSLLKERIDNKNSADFFLLHHIVSWEEWSIETANNFCSEVTLFRLYCL